MALTVIDSYHLFAHAYPKRHILIDTLIFPVAKMSTLPVPQDEKMLHDYGWDSISWSVYKKDDAVFAVNTTSERYENIEVNYMGAESVPKKIAKSFRRRHKSIVNFGKWITKVDDGWLIGLNRGEFGAALYWYSNDGKSEYEISNDHVIQFMRRNDQIYALQGVTHLSYSGGTIQKIVKRDGKWESVLAVALPEAPKGADIDSRGDMIVGTSNGLYRVGQHFNIIPLVTNAFWNKEGYLYPKSLLIKDDVVYYGMRGGIYQYNLLTKKEEWLVKKP